MFLTEIKEHLKQNKAPYILGVLVSLLTPLFLVIWQRWLYGVLAQRGQAIPRQVLGAVIGVLIILLLALFALVVLYVRELSALKKPAQPTIRNIDIDNNDIRIMKMLTVSKASMEADQIGMFTGLHPELVKYRLHKLVEAKYVHVYAGMYSLDQRGREYLITNNLLI